MYAATMKKYMYYIFSFYWFYKKNVCCGHYIEFVTDLTFWKDTSQVIILLQFSLLLGVLYLNFQKLLPS